MLYSLKSKKLHKSIKNICSFQKNYEENLVFDDVRYEEGFILFVLSNKKNGAYTLFLGACSNKI